jgi:hypothetical protein
MTRLAYAFVASVWLFGCRHQEGGSILTAPPPRPAPNGGPAALDEMDTRTPVPLLPMMANHQKQNMRDHLVAVQDIVHGLATNDFDAIGKAAKRIGVLGRDGPDVHTHGRWRARLHRAVDSLPPHG